MNTEILHVALHVTGELVNLEHEFRRIGHSIILATKHAALHVAKSPMREGCQMA